MATATATATPEQMNHERRISALETSHQHVATKADLERMANKLLIWFATIWIASMSVYMAALIGLATLILNRMG